MSLWRKILAFLIEADYEIYPPPHEALRKVSHDNFMNAAKTHLVNPLAAGPTVGVHINEADKLLEQLRREAQQGKIAPAQGGHRNYWIYRTKTNYPAFNLTYPIANVNDKFKISYHRPHGGEKSEPIVDYEQQTPDIRQLLKAHILRQAQKAPLRIVFKGNRHTGYRLVSIYPELNQDKNNHIKVRIGRFK